MNLTSVSQVREWCMANGFHPNKVMGQNFLIDRNVLTAIVDAGLDGVDGGNILEIGPGLGVMTEELLRRGRGVTAIEKDPVLAGRLAESLGGPAGLSVVAGDALDVIRDILPSQSFAAMISNLPYQAGTRILLDVLQTRAISSVTVLVQSEVADRLAAGPGSKTRGLAGVWAQLDYDVKVVRKVSAQCFWPRPEIGSSVVKLVRHDRNAALSADERAVFRRLTKKAFEHRRKQLGSIFRDLIDSTARAEELTNEEWVNLAKEMSDSRVFDIIRL